MVKKQFVEIKKPPLRRFFLIEKRGQPYKPRASAGEKYPASMVNTWSGWVLLNS